MQGFVRALRSRQAIQCHAGPSCGRFTVPHAVTGATCNVMTRSELADRLVSLAAAERDSVKSWIGELEFPHHIAWLVEACRVMDYYHVLQNLSKGSQKRLSQPDFEIMVRGWNPALGLLLPFASGFRGIPAMESTPQSRGATLTLLHQLGRSVVLAETADMLRHGMVDGEVIDDRIVLRMSARTTLDHFLDRLEVTKLKRLERVIGRSSPYDDLLEKTKVSNLEDRMAALVFPWDSGFGTMIGYNAELDIDNHYLARVLESTLDWQNEAGIHPDCQVRDVSGGDLIAVGMLMVSGHLKHIRLVDIGCRKIPEANLPMSLTIWKERDAWSESICDFTGMPKDTVAAVLELFTVGHQESAYFENELTPFIPMLVEVSDGYLVAPVSSIFKNPFQGVRMLQEQRSSITEASVREPRENWMISDLCHLFLGNRYIVIDTPIRLKRHGRTVTDIDAAVLDRTTSTVALFQLKWQDFNTYNVKTQRSKAKNFVDRVDGWVAAVEGWLHECGHDQLCDVLRLPRHHGEQLADVRLFAVGRRAARFQSYGYAPTRDTVAVCTWPQFVRTRYEVGPAENVFRTLHAAIRAEAVRSVVTRPLRHEVAVQERQVVFENFWNAYEGEDDDAE